MATEADTTLDDHVTKPSSVVPGDAPADTTDPDEIATSVPPNPGEEAIASGTVNAVKKTGTRPGKPKPKGKPRIEKYTATRPDGQLVDVERNIETGESTVTEAKS